MRESRKKFVRLGIIAVLVCIFSLPVVSYASDPVDPAGAAAGKAIKDGIEVDVPDVVAVGGAVKDGDVKGISAGAAAAEGIAVSKEGGIQAELAAATPWGAPVLVSPNSGTALYHYPRWTTLAWKPVTGATSYRVERAYLSGSTWTAYSPVTVTGNINCKYTFSFVGDQAGRWRVTAYNGTTWSPPSAWWTFSYNTKPQMETPILTNPYPNEAFDHYPRQITLSWKMVPRAVGYTVEIAYCLDDKVTCWDMTPVTRTGALTSYYTFNFVGAQPGKWRVTTIGAPTYRDSTPSAWRWFSFGN
jgi:hypothetical protein